MLALPFIDVGIAQNVMLSAAPPRWATWLPAHGAVRVLLDGGFTATFDETGALLRGLGWLAGLTLLAAAQFRRLGAPAARDAGRRPSHDLAPLALTRRSGAHGSVPGVRTATVTTVKVVVVMFLWAVCFPLITVGLELAPHLAFATLRALIAGGAPDRPRRHDRSRARGPPDLASAGRRRGRGDRCWASWACSTPPSSLRPERRR